MQVSLKFMKEMSLLSETHITHYISMNIIVNWTDIPQNIVIYNSDENVIGIEPSIITELQWDYSKVLYAMAKCHIFKPTQFYPNVQFIV